MVLVVERKVFRRSILHLKVNTREFLFRFLRYYLESNRQSLIWLNNEIYQPFCPFGSYNILVLVSIRGWDDYQIPILIHNPFNEYVKIVKLLFCYLLYRHVHRIYIRNLESFCFDIIHRDIVEIYFIAISTQGDILKAYELFLFFKGAYQTSIKYADCNWNQCVVHNHRYVLVALRYFEILSLKFDLSILNRLTRLQHNALIVMISGLVL